MATTRLPSEHDVFSPSALAVEPTGATRLSLSVATQPGILEQALVVLAMFVFYHQTPNAWFLTPADITTDFSNPMAAGTQLVLILIAFARVAGSIDYLIQMVRLESSVFLFAGLSFLSIFWSADPSETTRRAIMFMAVTAFAGYLVLRFPLQRFLLLLSVMFVVSAVLNIAWIAVFPQYGIDQLGRFTGIFIQKNALGYTNALAIPTLVIAAISQRRARVFFLAFAIIHSVLLIGSESKTMLIAGFVPTALMGVYQGFRGRKTLRGAVLLSLSGSGLFTLAFATANIELLARWLDKDVSLTGRVPLWESLVPIALDRPLLGHGFAAAFGGFFSPIHEVWIQNGWEAPDAHNAVLQIWLELGLVGVAIFLWSYGRAVSRAIKIVAIVPGGVGLWPLVFLTATLLLSITESGIQSDSLGWTMYLVAVLSVSLHLRHRASLGLSNDMQEATSSGRGPGVVS